MSERYRISASTHNLRCKICGHEYFTGSVRVCLICGIILCKRHFHYGFCERHFNTLRDGDKQKIQQNLHENARGEKITYLLLLGFFGVLFGTLAFPMNGISIPGAWVTVCQIVILTVGIGMTCYALAYRFQKDDREVEIRRIAKRYEKAEEKKLQAAENAPSQKVVPQDLTCPHCSSYNLANAKFCSTCGKEMEIKRQIEREISGCDYF